MKPIVKTQIYYQPTKIFKLILSRINKRIAKKNSKKNLQLVIFSFDHIGLSINMDGRYENENLILLEKFINEKIPNSDEEIALDIGANIGNHSIFFSKYFKKVFAFEPNPKTYDLLLINSKLISQKKIVPYNFGLSNNNGNLSLKSNPSNIGASRIISLPTNQLKNNITNIKVKIADEIKSIQTEKISFIKIDVEGHEINALKGAENIIKSNKPIIVFEQQAKEIKNQSSEVIEYLTTLNYNFYTIVKRFYFGESFLGKLLGLLLRIFFGEQLSLVKTTRFDKRFYSMIIAI